MFEIKRKHELQENNINKVSFDYQSRNFEVGEDGNNSIKINYICFKGINAECRIGGYTNA